MTDSALTQAVQKHEWELVALCLLLGMARVLQQVPPEALPAMLDLLSESEEMASRPRPGVRRKQRRAPSS